MTPNEGRALCVRISDPCTTVHRQFKRRIRTRTAQPSAETTAMRYWALLASGQIAMHKVDGRQSLGQTPADSAIDLAA